MTTACPLPGHPSRDDGPAALAALIIARSLRSGTSHHTTPSTETDNPDWLPATLGVPSAARLLGISRTTAYSLARQDRFPCPVIKVGQQYRVPTVQLLRLLGLSDTGSAPPTSNIDC
jgi:hypothetical protein